GARTGSPLRLERHCLSDHQSWYRALVLSNLRGGRRLCPRAQHVGRGGGAGVAGPTHGGRPGGGSERGPARRGTGGFFCGGGAAGGALSRRGYPFDGFAGRSADLAAAELAEDRFAPRLAEGAVQPRAQQIGVGGRMAFVTGRRTPGLAVLSSGVAGDARAADDAFFGRAADSGEVGRPPGLRGRTEGA